MDEDKRITWTRHERGAGLLERHADEPSVARMAAFTHGFYSVSEEYGRLFVTDLRMGQEPRYTFHFDLGTEAARANGAHRPEIKGARPDIGPALSWLWRRLRGERIPSPGV